MGKNASDICAMLSKAYSGELKKSQVFLRSINSFKESLHVENTNEDNVNHFL
jgi:hypothetical protein